ncbi:hypothetical protein A4H97_22470 [Niastella yeongjuensis]|uniref:Uncharacterized protein n=1 Tax=Niastella yeongjuensis TaxID=354355 RepID=A0A1V9F778_9BACT|nr:hypothetical protein A4H97_22470 [Niastella yeongjuensis]SEP31163.1 Fructosamine kinase [Niastella yeongjuensis]
MQGKQFRLATDNYMGSLPQSNQLTDNWIDFFIQQRLLPQVKLAVNRQLPEPVQVKQFFGHRSIDIAMTTLFGGFDNLFYESYNYHYRLPVNYRQQWKVCNLYPLLIHLNLFGKSYLADIVHTIARY